MTLISETEARQSHLVGCDVFKRTQLAYKDELNRDHLVVSLNIEALKILNLSVTLGQRVQLKTEAEQLKQQLEDGTFKLHEYKISQSHSRLMEYTNLEFFYIATGFELHFKAWLIQNNFIVNIIEKAEPFKSLKYQQTTRPISKEEFFALGNFQYDTSKQINLLQGLTEQSLNFSTICNNIAYTNALNISSDILGLVEDYRNLRNQIHLPGDVCESPNLERLGATASDLMAVFINERIVKNSNNLIMQRDFGYFGILKEI